LMNRGRSVPMVWFYKDTLDTEQLVDSLQTTLASYPVLCGRYASPATAVDLCNAGVPVTVCTVDMTLDEAIAHISPTTPSFFSRTAHEVFVPTKAGMDPDPGIPDAPLFSAKISTFASGGTAIGILMQHGIVDAESMITFVRHWAQTFSGKQLQPTPCHDRLAVNQIGAGGATPGEKPGHDFKVKTLPVGDRAMPEFVGVMPRIMGEAVCLVPFSRAILRQIKGKGSEGLTDGSFVSTDDLVTAHIWRALCVMRRDQGLAEPEDCTTMCRAVNFRKRTEPRMAEGYCANGVCQVWTELSVQEVLSMRPVEVALRLRAGLSAHSSDDVGARTQWLLQNTAAGLQTKGAWDAKALTFIVSSWIFDWEGALFGDARPVAYDQGCLAPIAFVIVPRPKGDGVGVYATGPQEAVETFAWELMNHADVVSC